MTSTKSMYQAVMTESHSGIGEALLTHDAYNRWASAWLRIDLELPILRLRCRAGGEVEVRTLKKYYKLKKMSIFFSNEYNG